VVLTVDQPIGSIATALGLGLGSSRFLADPANVDFFSSPGLSLLTGGGTIDGNADATASTTGRNDNSAEASAVNIGLANVDLVTRGGGELLIGTAANPFSATASAATRSLLSPQSDPFLTAQLTADATVRGLEGSPPDAPAPAAAPALGIPPTFYGQPNAAVLAAANLNLDPGPTTTAASAVADAKGIEGYQVFALAPGPAAPPNTPALVSGLATANLTLAGAPPTNTQPADLAATAIGIDQAVLRGPASGSVVFQGSGLALLNAPAVLPPGAVNLQSLQGIGIEGSNIQSNGGTTAVVGTGGFAAPNSGGLLSGMDAAGIDNSAIYSGSGSLTVMGKILTEQQAGVDANGDGVISPSTFLDASALTGGQGGFNGIRNSTIISNGPGTAQVYGSSNTSQIDLTNGSINLDRAMDSSLAVNNGSIVVGTALDNSLAGGFGTNLVEVTSGSGNSLDGGFGQDVVIGPASGSASGGNTFMQSNAGAALDAASRNGTPGSTSTFAERLTDPAFWAGLGAQQKQTLWDTGTLVQGGQTFTEDTFQNFHAGNGGDVLEVSSTLGSLTQNLWDSQGALFGVQGGQLKVLDGPANSQLGLVVGTLADIRSLGIGSPSLAYATDTRQLMFDADGDWKDGGSQSLGTVTMANPGVSFAKDNFKFA
jgi:hypothetical protein